MTDVSVLAEEGLLAKMLCEFERKCIVEALRRRWLHRAQKTITARDLGISRKCLWEKIRRYRILNSELKRPPDDQVAARPARF